MHPSMKGLQFFPIVPGFRANLPEIHSLVCLTYVGEHMEFSASAGKCAEKHEAQGGLSTLIAQYFGRSKTEEESQASSA